MTPARLPRYMDASQQFVVWCRRTKETRDLVGRLLPRDAFVVYAGNIWTHPDHVALLNRGRV